MQLRQTEVIRTFNDNGVGCRDVDPGFDKNGFQPVEAEDYDSAVNQLNEPWPDLILLDWMLPGGSAILAVVVAGSEKRLRFCYVAL